jgi:hypothetical protein
MSAKFQEWACALLQQALRMRRRRRSDIQPLFLQEIK